MPVAVVGILPQQDDLDLVQRRQLKGIEDLVLGRINGVSSTLAIDKLFERFEIGFVEFPGQDALPAR